MEQELQRTVVVQYSEKALNDILESPEFTERIPWAYLGKNVSTYLEIEQILGRRGENVQISEMLQDNACMYRQEYIDFIGQCASESQNPWWYLTSISEKNPFVSDLFLNFCYLKTFFDLLDHKESLCIICEDPWLIGAIRKNTTRPWEDRIRFIPACSPVPADNRFSRYRRIKNKVVFLTRFMLRIAIARTLYFFRRGNGNGKTGYAVMIHSWTDHRSFSADGKYIEVYLGDLAARLDKKAESVCYLIDVLPTIFFPVAVIKMLKSKTPWYLFEESLRFMDILDAFSRISEIYQEPIAGAKLAGLFIDELTREEFLRDIGNSRTELSYLYCLAGKRISETMPVGSFVYTFENHIWEKMMIKGLRESRVKPRIIGYAHATVNSMELSYSVSTYEKQNMPLPDSILVNGIQPREILTESGFDPASVHIAGSLRYGGLSHLPLYNPSRERNRVLIILSADINRSLEMIHKCRETFGMSRDFFITIKPHPIQKTEVIQQFSRNLPDFFRIVDDPLDKLLEKTDLVVFSDSTASVEAAAYGIPILHVKSDFLIDTNIFENCRSVPSVNSSGQIRTTAEALLNLPEHELREYQETICRSILELFAPVDEEILMKEIFGR